mmetsp:Transcript_8093/g.14626  ORF Transcript_8093/g.14626 Transcript_8093/m.14626 type:complete len:461 (-) Transcript_8093:175-1557(-)
MSSASNDETHNSDSHDHEAAEAEAGMSSIDLTTTTNDLTNDPTTIDIDPTSLANAEHLDRLEASEAVLDIASFQDIELPPNNNDATPQPEPPSSPTNAATSQIRRAKRYYYCLPMMTHYKFAIIGCILMLGLFLVAVGLSASSLKRSNNAASKATTMAEEEEALEKKGAMVIDDDPNYDNDYFGTVDNEWGEGEEWTDGYDEWEGGNDGGWGGGQGGGEELGNGVEERVTDPPTNAPSKGGEEDLGEVSMEAKVTDPPPTDAPRESPSPTISKPTAIKMTPSPTTDKPTEPHAPNPQWFQTSGAQYQTYLSNHNEMGGDHSHILSALFCIKQNLSLCSFNEYCPNGQGSDPYQGGPKTATATWNTPPDSLEKIQWAPIIVTSETDAQTAEAGGHWVQVGTIPQSDEGSVDNGFGKCWTWEEWSGAGENGLAVDLEVEWGEDHRRWILCCDEKEEEGWGDD